MLGATFHVGGAWATSALGDSTSFGTSLTVDSSGRGVGVYTSTTGGLVSYTVWSGGAWSAPVAVPQSLVALSQPFADATGSAGAQVIYQDASYHYWFLGYTSAWTQAQAVGTATNQSYGPVPATIAALGANATAAFIDGESPNVNYAAEADRTGGAWGAQADLAGPESYTISPVIVPMSGGPELMMIFVQQSTQIMFITRTSGVWSTPAAVTSALTGDRVALAPLPGGGAILAFRGTDTNLYWSVYSSGAWSTVAPFASPNVAVDTSPAVTHGIGGDVAEMAYVSGGVAYHARLSGSTWAAPVLVGGASLDGVAIAAAP
jgi:hypothetical protein